MVKIVFMGTPEFACAALQILIDCAEVVGVVTQPDRPAGRGKRMQPPPVKELALKAGIPIYQPLSLKKEEDAAPIRDWAPDLIVVAAYGQILRTHLLDFPPHGCLNIHASLLPRWRGASPIHHALLAGDKETGISLMKMDRGLDTGAVYCMESIAIGERETAVQLHDRLAHLGAEMVKRHLDAIVTGRMIPQPQEEEGKSYARIIQKEDGLLHWEETAVQLDRRIRAMNPWPGSYSFWQGTRLKILEAYPISLEKQAEIGTVLQIEDQFVVQCGEGGLLLQQIQLAGKKGMSVSQFLQGQPDFLGSILGRQGS